MTEDISAFWKVMAFGQAGDTLLLFDKLTCFVIKLELAPEIKTCTYLSVRMAESAL
jgi:hypothetical protein